MAPSRFRKKDTNIQSPRVSKLSAIETKKIQSRARTTFANCTDLFRKDAMNEEDLAQEALLVAYETLNHYNTKSEKELIKLIHKRVSWKMKELIRNARRRNKKFANISSKEPIIMNNSTETCTLEDTMVSPDKKPFLKLAFTLCNEKEYNLLYKRFVENKIFQEIAQEEGMTKQNVKRIYSNILNSLKNKLKISKMKKTSEGWNKQEKFEIIVPKGWNKQKISKLSDEWFKEKITKEEFYNRIGISLCNLTEKQLLSWRMQDKLKSKEKKERRQLLEDLQDVNEEKEKRRQKRLLKKMEGINNERPE